MSFGLSYDSIGNPTVAVVGDELPGMYPPDAAWMILGGGGGVYQPEYEGAMGMVLGSAAAGIRWGATVVSAGPDEQRRDVADWSVSAALFLADGTPVRPLSCSVLSATEWTIESPTFGPGQKRVAIIGITSRKPGCATTLRTPVLLMVAAVP